jgi:hypothetical protein
MHIPNKETVHYRYIHNFIIAHYSIIVDHTQGQINSTPETVYISVHLSNEVLITPIEAEKTKPVEAIRSRV